MKATMQFGEIRIEAEGDVKEVFTELSQASEVFSQTECGNCGSHDVVPCVRDHDGNTYYEMQCRKCGCTLGFGQRKADGKLYPRRKGKDGQWLQNNGWQDWKTARAAASEVEPF